jgi:hypothetical protein
MEFIKHTLVISGHSRDVCKSLFFDHLSRKFDVCSQCNIQQSLAKTSDKLLSWWGSGFDEDWVLELAINVSDNENKLFHASEHPSRGIHIPELTPQP